MRKLCILMTLALADPAAGEDPTSKFWSDSITGEKISVVPARYRDIMTASLKEEGFLPDQAEPVISRPFLRTKGQSAFCSVGVGQEVTFLIEIDRQSGKVLQKGYFNREGKPVKRP